LYHHVKIFKSLKYALRLSKWYTDLSPPLAKGVVAQKSPPVIARSAATRQSSSEGFYSRFALDCFVIVFLAMTDEKENIDTITLFQRGGITGAPREQK